MVAILVLLITGNPRSTKMGLPPVVDVHTSLCVFIKYGK
jgi:hypothetical protein